MTKTLTLALGATMAAGLLFSHSYASPAMHVYAESLHSYACFTAEWQPMECPPPFEEGDTWDAPEEDEPGWNCATMGNLSCGSGI